MANIYEITEAFATIQALAEDGELTDEIIAELFENALGDLTDKLGGYGRFLVNLKTDIAGLKAEEERLATKRKRLEDLEKRSKEACKRAMEAAGKTKIESGSFTFSIRKNPPSCVIDCETAGIPSKYLIPQEPTIDKKAILEDLKKEDHILHGVAHIEQGESLTVR